MILRLLFISKHGHGYSLVCRSIISPFSFLNKAPWSLEVVFDTFLNETSRSSSLKILSEAPQKLYSKAPLIGCSFRLLFEAPLMKLLSEAPLWIYCKGLIRRNIWTPLKSLLFWNKQTSQSSTFILLSSAGLSCSDSNLMSVFLLLNISPPPPRCYRSSSSLCYLFFY